MDIAFSPCPNDTYLFHAWATGLIGPPVTPHLLDIETLNQNALMGTFDLTKISCALLPEIQGTYQPLPIGAALGFGCGPKLVAKKPFPLEDLPKKTIAIPGEHTTAHRLLQMLCPPPAKKTFCPYHQTLHQPTDCAIIIHEQRFTFQKQDYIEITDLGALWEKRYNLPIPLGLLVAKWTLPLEEITNTLRLSLQKARQKMPRDYILKYAQDPTAINEQIELYVNQETENLSPIGQQAIEILCPVS